MSEIYYLYVFLFVPILIVIFYCLGRYIHYIKWNNGIHKKDNGKWVYEFTDSQLNHSFHCSICGKNLVCGWLFKEKEAQ